MGSFSIDVSSIQEWKLDQGVAVPLIPSPTKMPLTPRSLDLPPPLQCMNESHSLKPTPCKASHNVTALVEAVDLLLKAHKMYHITTWE